MKNPPKTGPAEPRGGRASKRDAILEAAGRVVHRDGAERMTLDSVAAEAGVSKGGLLYHFECKDALIRGLVQALIDRFEAAVQALRDDDDRPGSFCRAYLRATLAADPADDTVAAGLLAAVAQEKDLLAPLRTRYAVWDTALRADGVSAADALVLRFAVDGLWFAALLGLAPPSADTRRLVSERLLALLGEARS